MAKNNIGPNRLVVGAHYGLKDWLAQRVTAVVMVIYTFVLLGSFLTGQNFTYEGWAGLFSTQWVKVFSLVTFLALYYHVWVGMRDVWMDYVKPVGIRLALQIITMLWLIACSFYTVQILWGL
jgi:succinate dehydrogenase / fumarate reductase membrane anchor subunit